jgi:hypothetical protein
MRPYLKKPFIKIGLVEWLKVKALSSSPSTSKRKKKQARYLVEHIMKRTSTCEQINWEMI